MRRLAALPIGLAVILLAAAGWAQATLTYVHGMIELAQPDGWRELVAGSQLPADATLRLGVDSFAELSTDDLRITLTQGGIYSLPDLKSFSREVSRWSIASVVRNKVRALFSAPTPTESTPMGTRATDVWDDDGFGWMDDQQEAYERGKSALVEERYADAARSFQEALKLAESPNRPVYRFYLGYALALAGEDRAARQVFDQIEDPQSLAHYGEYVLLAARLAIEGQSFVRAETMLERFLDTHPGHPATQEALFLAAFCSQRLGRDGEAADRLLRAIDLDPGTETAAAARRALAGI